MSEKSLVTRRGFIKGAAAVTGAGVLASVAPRMSQAETRPTPSKWDMETDVLVAGGGLAGCMAAIEAAQAGLKVVLLQATPDLGGNSRISSAWIRSVNTRWHEKLGISDTVEAYAKDIVDYGNGTRNPAKAKVIAAMSSVLVNRLMDYGVKFTDEKDTVNGGPTLRVPKVDGRGEAVMKAVGGEVSRQKNITVHTDSKILDIYRTFAPDNFLGGYADIEGKKVNIKAKAFVLATGGFGRNQKLVTKYVNQWKDTFRIMDVEAKGDGLLLASAHGAGVANLQVAMVTPLMEYTKRIFYSSSPLLMGAIFVNEQGKRFVNELIIYTTTNIEMLKQKAVYEIVTEDLHPLVQQMIKDRVTTKADSIEELAQKLNVPVENIRYEIEEHNRITQLTKDRVDRFGRIAFNKTLNPPFYFLRVHPVMIETVGGIMINEKAQVINLKEQPVMSGFYAAGAVAFGEHFGVGYRSGDAYVYSGVFGIVAGQEAARFSKSKS